MNEQIKELAKQSGFENGHQDRYGNSLSQELEKFAELVAEKERERMTVVVTDAAGKAIDVALKLEREACAKICDLAMLQNQEAINELENDEHIAKCFIQGAMNQLVKTAKAIRARGKA